MSQGPSGRKPASPVLLYGAGKEGKSTRAFLAEHYPDLKVYVTVDSGGADIRNAPVLSPVGLDPARFGTIVKSPGVSRYKRFFEQARDSGVKVTTNLNLWAEHFRAGRQVIAITGTKGKSTTATLTHLMLKHSGVDALLAGNVGVAPLDAADKSKVVVFELSSYQTADMNFAPDIAGITNLYPEHVDWHGSTEQYYTDKLRLIAQDLPMQVALGPQAERSERVKSALQPGATLLSPLEAATDAALTEAVAESKLKGAHNLDNARLAARLALAAGATLKGILAGVAAFKPLPHRLEEMIVGDKLFVDDSIATTPEATKAALAAYKGSRIALIAGGHEREQDYTELARLLAPSGVVRLCCLPVTGARLAEAARTAAPDLAVDESPTLEDAIKLLHTHLDEFDTVILSPGAPSYNQFKNFEERGEAFKALAQRYFGE